MNMDFSENGFENSCLGVNPYPSVVYLFEL